MPKANARPAPLPIPLLVRLRAGIGSAGAALRPNEVADDHRDSGRAVRRAKSPKKVRDMLLGRRGGDAQDAADLLIRCPTCDQRHDLALAWSELGSGLVRWILGPLAEPGAESSTAEGDLTGADPADGVDERAIADRG
jgi:hypothetical protein